MNEEILDAAISHVQEFNRKTVHECSTNVRLLIKDHKGKGIYASYYCDLERKDDVLIVIKYAKSKSTRLKTGILSTFEIPISEIASIEAGFISSMSHRTYLYSNDTYGTWQFPRRAPDLLTLFSE